MSVGLRFSDFSEDWHSLSLNDLGAFVSDGIHATPVYYENGAYYFINGNNLVNGKIVVGETTKRVNHSEYQRHKKPLANNTILMSINGTIGNLAFYNSEKVILGKSACYINLDLHQTDKLFVYYLLQTPTVRKKFHSALTGTTIKNLSLAAIKKTKFGYPSIEEQRKIAGFLGAVDGKLEALRRKRELLAAYKRGVMQKLFAQEIRFRRDDGRPYPDWEIKKLGQLAKRQTAKNTSDAISRVLTNSATQGVVDQTDYFKKDIANANNLMGYYVIEKGDYVYNPRISVHAPVGPIKKNHLGQGVMSPLYTVFRFNSENNEFYEHYFQTTQWHRYMCSVANYGARHDRMNITIADFLAMPLPLPVKEEQQKIVDFLRTIDKKIEATNQQVEQIETFKKGLLQQMFV